MFNNWFFFFNFFFLFSRLFLYKYVYVWTYIIYDICAWMPHWSYGLASGYAEFGNCLLGLSLCLDSRFINHVCVLFFFFFCFHAFLEECGYCSMNSSHKCWLFSVNSASVHCSRTHKFHFLSIFSLKIGPTVLFTHLKIILLQWFQQ